ncbi:methyl-accepting chemotaxis protein [Algicella marina]|nr:methyl-accepting chemotaxis protein [Algicella marina]
MSRLSISGKLRLLQVAVLVCVGLMTASMLWVRVANTQAATAAAQSEALSAAVEEMQRLLGSIETNTALGMVWTVDTTGKRKAEALAQRETDKAALADLIRGTIAGAGILPDETLAELETAMITAATAADAALDAYETNTFMAGMHLTTYATQKAMAQEILDPVRARVQTDSRQALMAQKATYQRGFNVLLLLGGATIAICGALLEATRRNIGASLTSVNGVLRRIAQDDVEAEVPSALPGTEVGMLVEAASIFRDKAKQRLRLEAERQAEQKATQARSQAAEHLQAELRRVIGRAVAGDFSDRIAAQPDDDAGGEIGRQINALFDTLDGSLAQVRDVMKRLAQKDLRHLLNGSFDGVFADLQSDVNATVTQLQDLVNGLQDASAGVRTSSDEIDRQARSLAEKVVGQAAALEETAATTEEMASSVRTNTEMLKETATMASGVTADADQGRETVKTAKAAMSRIEESSGRINDILTVIESISFQTNLLALNAAVEAARAGEAGKGFAVVASEVRTLAQRSADAAHDIAAVIKESGETVADGVALVEKTGQALDKIAESAVGMAESIRQVSEAGIEQANGVSEINQSIASLDSATQHNSVIADQTASVAQKLVSDANCLDEMLTSFLMAERDTRVKAA